MIEDTSGSNYSAALKNKVSWASRQTPYKLNKIF